MDGTPIPTKQGRDTADPPILCHFCDFESDRDSYVESHREKMHRKQSKEVEEIGLFWSVARYLRKKTRRMPLLRDFMQDRQTFRCAICGIHKDKMDNMAQHLKKAHGTTSKENIISVTIKYDTEGQVEEDMEATEQTEEEAPEEILPVTPQYIDITEQQFGELERMDITKERLSIVLKTKNLEAFKVMLRLIMMSETAPIAPFMQAYREMKEDNEICDTPKFKDDMGDWLWKIRVSDIPHWKERMAANNAISTLTRRETGGNTENNMQQESWISHQQKMW